MTLSSVLKERENKRRSFRKHALNEAKRLITLLKEHFEFESVYIVGSILTDRFWNHSDIDLVIKGLKMKDFFKAHAFLIKRSEYPIDLKPFEDLTDDFKKEVLLRGMKVG